MIAGPLVTIALILFEIVDIDPLYIGMGTSLVIFLLAIAFNKFE
jgi:hypothetical protein